MCLPVFTKNNSTKYAICICRLVCSTVVQGVFSVFMPVVAFKPLYFNSWCGDWTAVGDHWACSAPITPSHHSATAVALAKSQQPSLGFGGAPSSGSTTQRTV